MPVTTNVLPLSKFSFDKCSGQLTAEASDFGPARDGQWWLQKLYVDAADVGIAIYSETTGRYEMFYLDDAKENDGDLLYWHFLPVDPNCRAKSVVIFND